MHVLFGVDGSEPATAALAIVSRFPLSSPGKACLLKVLVSPEDEESARESLRSQSQILKSAGWNVRVLLREGEDAAATILAVADELDAGLIGIGCGSRSRLRGFLLGSVADRVCRYATRPVLVARTRPQQSEATGRLRLLLAFDGSDPARAALRWLVSQLAGPGLEVRVLTVLQVLKMFRMDIVETTSSFWQKEKAAAHEELLKAASELEECGALVATELSESAQPGAEINRVAEEMEADLIVIGDQGRNAARQVLLSGVTDSVIHYGPCSVLILKDRGEELTIP